MSLLAVPKSLFSTLVLALAASLVHAQSGDIKEIRFGTDPTYRPYEYKDDKGNLVGMDIDIGNALCKELQAKCTWVPMSFDAILPSVQQNKVDAGISSIIITEKRKEIVNFTDRTYLMLPGLVTHQNATIKPTPTGVKGKKIGVLSGSLHATFAKEVWAPAGAEIIPYKTQAEIYPLLAAGKLDATLTDSVEAESAFVSTPAGDDFVVVQGSLILEPRLSSPSAIVVNKQNPLLLKRLNEALAKLKKSGQIKAIAHKYVKYDILAR